MDNRYKELDELYDISRTLYINNELQEEEILLSAFIKFKEIIDEKAISISKYNIERFFDYMVFDYIFLSKPLESKLFKADKYITLDIYPNYQIFIYHFHDIGLEFQLKTRTDFLNLVNNNKLSNQELKIVLLHLYYTVYPIYMHKNVTIKNELEIFNKYIEIEKLIEEEFVSKTNGDIAIDNTIVIFDSKRNEEGLLKDKLLIKIKDIS